MINVHVIHWICQIKLDLINLCPDSKPADILQLQCIPVELCVGHKRPLVVTLIVCPSSEVTSIRQVLQFFEIFVHSTIAEAIAEVRFMDHGVRSEIEVLEQPDFVFCHHLSDI